MKLRVLVLLALAVAPGVARAADDPAVTELASALAIPALQRVGRVAIVMAGPDTLEAAQFRTVVATAFVRAGHPIVWGKEPLGGPEPDRALLAKYWTEQHASGVAVVRFSTPFELSRGSVVLYDAVGTAPLFLAFANRSDASRATPAPIWTARPIVDTRQFPGLALYQEIGRKDLVGRYRNRELGKALSFVGGGLVVTGWCWLQFLKQLATIDSDYKPTVTGLEVAWLAGGIATMVVPTFISSDPLTPAEREALVGGRPVSLGVGAAPLPGGGAFSLALRY